MKNNISRKINVYESDVPKEYAKHIRRTKALACDIETTGLDWKNDEIGTCQLCNLDRDIAIIKLKETPPKRLISLISDFSIKKVFHYAVFDLRFLVYRWNFTPKNITCTKVASKLLNKSDSPNNHTLQNLLNKYLEIKINKIASIRISNWIEKKLSQEQIIYAAKDVLYLLPLLDKLEQELDKKGLLSLAHRCFTFIPIKVQLDVLGYSNIYKY